VNAEYRAVIIEVDPDFFRIELDALEQHLTEIGLAAVAVYDPEHATYCTRTRTTHPLDGRQCCGAQHWVSRGGA
jgi:hypothetical protein